MDEFRDEFSEGELYCFNEKKARLFDLIIANPQMEGAFVSILEKLDAKYFLIEYDYVDRDFLEDFSNYYVSCHKPYDRFCRRVHFFTSSDELNLGQFQFNDLFLISDSQKVKGIQEKLNEVYLGFFVLKPFQTNVIGRTCLKHYNENLKINRRYNALREYNVNLYGIPLSVASMAFQEQDETIGACATMALWSAFNITGKKFQHPIPSPSEVTKMALSASFHSKHFPNEGLTAEQMAVAISKMGLMPNINKPMDNRGIKSLIYAYLRAEIPIIGGISLYDVNEVGDVIISSRSFHAVTINGFSFQDDSFSDDSSKEEVTIKNEEVRFSDGIKRYSSRMTKFFAHDDQLCPFARMTFSEKYQKFENNIAIQPIFTSWANSNEKSKDKGLNKVAKVEALIIPLYHKIRTTYEDIIKYVSHINRIIDNYTKITYNKSMDLEWDVFLTKANDLKTELLFTSKSIIGGKSTILKTKLPKYVWRARAFAVVQEGKKERDVVFEILFDSTETKNGHHFLSYIVFDKKAQEVISEIKYNKLWKKAIKFS